MNDVFDDEPVNSRAMKAMKEGGQNLHRNQQTILRATVQ